MSEVKFSKEHEWIKLDGDTATIGITQHATEMLGDIVFVELPEIGSSVVKEGNPTSIHHPFTSPKNFNDLSEADVYKIPSRAYDLILNGNEIGGGSMRIHSKDIQMKVFELLNISEEEMNKKFGFIFLPIHLIYKLNGFTKNRERRRRRYAFAPLSCYSIRSPILFRALS